MDVQVSHLLVGEIVVIVVNLLVIGMGWGSLRQSLKDVKEEEARRFLRIEKFLGIENGGSGHFVARSEYALMEGEVARRLGRIEDRLEALDTRLLTFVVKGNKDT